MKKKNLIWLALVFNPLAVLVYIVFGNALISLAQYGDAERNLPILFTGFLLLLAWSFWCLYRYFKFKAKDKPVPWVQKFSADYVSASKIWLTIAGLALFSTTWSVSLAVYQSAAPLQEELAAYLNHVRNTRKIDFTHDDLYENGVDGLFADIKEELSLPHELYVADEFKLAFNQKGRITAIDVFLYGLNEENEMESFRIEYDSSKSGDIRVRLNDYVPDPVYDETKKLQPLLDLANTIPVKKTVSAWNGDSFEMKYTGVYNWGYDTEGIVAIDADGKTEKLETTDHQIVGYTVSISALENNALAPLRFVALSAPTDDLHEEAQLNESSELPEATADTYFLNSDRGYHLSEVDVAMGSRFYALKRTMDGGDIWETIHPDPFSGSLGISSGIVFIDEKLAFMGLSKSGGSYGELYRTEDGGYSFSNVEWPPVEVPLTDTETYAPFDFPEMPYMENGKLMLQVNQGQDGDYNGNSKALYQSNDEGKTWEFVKEVNGFR